MILVPSLPPKARMIKNCEDSQNCLLNNLSENRELWYSAFVSAQLKCIRKDVEKQKIALGALRFYCFCEKKKWLKKKRKTSNTQKRVSTVEANETERNDCTQKWTSLAFFYGPRLRYNIEKLQEGFGGDAVEALKNNFKLFSSFLELMRIWISK